MTPNDPSEALAALLEEERSALLNGDLDRVAEMVAEKESLIGLLQESEAVARDLPRLKQAMDRNHALFEQALAGLRSAITRVGALQSLRRSMVTYDSHGRREDIAAPSRNRLERRA